MVRGTPQAETTASAHGSPLPSLASEMPFELSQRRSTSSGTSAPTAADQRPARRTGPFPTPVNCVPALLSLSSPRTEGRREPERAAPSLRRRRGRATIARRDSRGWVGGRAPSANDVGGAGVKRGPCSLWGRPTCSLTHQTFYGYHQRPGEGSHAFKAPPCGVLTSRQNKNALRKMCGLREYAGQCLCK